MASVMCLHFNKQEEGILEHADVKCTFSQLVFHCER